jgi:hypothetical protein
VVLLMLIPLLAPTESGTPAGLTTIAQALGMAAIKVRASCSSSTLSLESLGPVQAQELRNMQMLSNSDCESSLQLRLEIRGIRRHHMCVYLCRSLLLGLASSWSGSLCYLLVPPQCSVLAAQRCRRCARWLLHALRELNC